MRLPSLVVLLTAGAANAEPPPSPVTVIAGLGYAWSHLDYGAGDYREAGFTDGIALRLDVAFRVHPNIAIGGHVAIAKATGYTCEWRETFCYDYDFAYNAIDLGATALITFDRAWIAPWLGIHKLSTEYDGDLGQPSDVELGGGLGVGYGVYRIGAHYVDVFTSAAFSMKHDFDPQDVPFVSFAVGIDFRY